VCRRRSSLDKLRDWPSNGRGLATILIKYYTHTHIIGTYHPIVERRNLLHASMVYIYSLTTRRLGSRRSLIIHGRCNEGAYVHAHIIHQKKEKSLCAHNTVLLQLCVCEMVLKCKLPRRNRRIAVNEYMCLHDGIISLFLSLFLSLSPLSLPHLYPLRMYSVVYNNNIIIIIIIIRHESIVPMLYIRGKDNCREYGGPTAASVTRLVAAADHRYIYI
jgi:hypothetical protein